MQASFPCVFFDLLIMHVCSNNLALYISIIGLTSGAPRKAKHWEQRPLGLDLISFYTEQVVDSVMEKVREWYHACITVLCVILTHWRGLEGSWLCSCQLLWRKWIILPLSVWIETQSTIVHLAWLWDDSKFYPDMTGWGRLGRSPVVCSKYMFYGCACLHE